jgi:large subunit ribosomal protein L23
MSNERLLKVLIAPLITEKTYRITGDDQQVAFEVAKCASKQEIKAAVEQMFDVKVTDVRTINVKGGVRRFGQIMGKTKDWKKAYVRLAPGAKIDFGGAEA